MRDTNFKSIILSSRCPIKGGLHLHSLSAKLKSGFDKWRLAFLAFAVIYALLLLKDLDYMSIQWDEVTHLQGGLFLLRGRFQDYIRLSALYPPMFDVITTGYFKVLGISVLAGRLVSVTFTLLSLWVVFELAYRMYEPKTALISSVLLGIMPGFMWLSRVAMIETMLVFFFTVSMLFFFNWLRTHQNKALVLSGVALGLGFLTKYQMLVAGLIMIASMLLLHRGYLKTKFSKFPLLVVTVAAIAIPWVFISYQIYTSGMLNQWLYILQVGSPERSLYSMRYPLPVFYLIEMTWPYSNVHPISLLAYILSLLGLGLLAWRRRNEDKFLLIWFFVVYVFFTLIANKQWRYVMPLFPVLAISAASFILSACRRAEKTWKSTQLSLNKKRLVKVAAGLFTVFIVTSIIFSGADAYYWVTKDQNRIPIEEATNYAAQRLNENESILVVCAFNLFSQDMVRFYLQTNESKRNEVWQYPALPVDMFTPNFDVDEVIALSEKHNVKYLFLYEYGSTYEYFNTTLTLHDVYAMLYYSGRFTYQTSFGTNPRRIFIMSFP